MSDLRKTAGCLGISRAAPAAGVFAAALVSMVCGLAARGEVVRQSDLVGWWQMGEEATWNGSAWVVPDLSGHGNTGTSVRMTQGDLVEGYPFAGVSGPSYAMRFTGSATRKYVGTEYDSSLALSSSFTLSAWVKQDTIVPGDAMLVNRCDGPPHGLRHNYCLQLAGGRVSSSFWNQEYGGWPKVTGPTVLDVGRWYHTAAVFDDAADTLSVYVNGVRDAQMTVAGYPSISSPFGVAIGGEASENKRWLDGTTDDVRIYNVALRAEEIAAIYNNGLGDYIGEVAVYQWRGGLPGAATDWGMAGNWSPNVVPNAPSLAVMFGSPGATGQVDLGNMDRTVGSMTFEAAVPATVLGTAGHTLILDNRAEPALIEAGGIHEIAVPVGLASDLTVAGDGRLTVSGEIAGEHGLVKTGPGTLVLSGVNTYTGPTVVESGVLQVDGLLAPQSEVSVQPGGALGGNGVVTGAVTVHDGAHVAPGASVGVLSVYSLDLEAGSVLDFEFGPLSHDQIDVLAADGLVWEAVGINLFEEGTTTPFAEPGTYPLLFYRGELGGELADLSILNPQPGLEYVFDLTSQPGWVSLSIVPEPGSLVLLGMAGLILLLWWRPWAFSTDAP